jgi:hypothetical protein
MNAVSGTRRAFKELADGTIRVQVDVEPSQRAAFFALFGEIDMPIALAPLAADFDLQVVEEEPAPEVEKPKGGELAKLAGILCADPRFQDWLSTPDEEGAARIVRARCCIESRAELDHNTKAAAIFHESFRKPWAALQ